MNLLRKLFGAKTKVEPVKTVALPVVEAKPPKPVISLDIVDKTDNEQELMKLAIDGPTSQLRQAAAEKLQTREVLDRVAKAVKVKDKNVFKLVKAKLDVFKAEDAKQAEVELSAQRICERLERHSHLEADALFKAKLSVLKNEWSALPAPSPTSQDRFAKAIAACDAKISARAQAIADEEEKRAQDQQAQQLAEDALINLKNLVKEIVSHDKSDEFAVANYEMRIQELGSAIRLAANRQLPLNQLINEFECRKQQTLNLIDQIKTTGTASELDQSLEQLNHVEAAKQAQYKVNQFIKSLNELNAETPPALESANAKINAFFAGKQQAEQVVKNALRDYSDLVRKGSWAAEQGFVRKARAIQKELKEKREQLEGLVSELPKAVQSKQDEFEAQLAKLGDWHEFAVTPKKEALIEQMQSLATSQIDPEVLATRIHELQDSWKEVSKGAQQQDDNLWQQFQQASAIAYAPCKEFFEAQAAAREANLVKRRELVTQLQHYLSGYDFANAVWKDVEQTLKTARSEWQNYWPVPRKAGNELQKEFESLMEQLFGKITQEYESNKAAKQQLVERAEALTKAEDPRAASEQIKQMQSQWKAIGKSWPREDQQLWSEFRKHCNVVFAKRNESFEAAKEQRLAIVARANDIIARLKQLSTETIEQLNTAKDEIDTLTNEFSSLALPKDSIKSLQQKFNDSLNDIDNVRNDARYQAEAKRWTDLFEVLEGIRAYETAVIGQADATALMQRKTDIENRIAAVTRWPSGALSVIQNRLSSVDRIHEKDQIKNEELLRLLTVRAEILAGLDSPEGDKALRMDYQVQQLQQGLGKRDGDFDALLLEWIAVGGVSSEPYSELVRRFEKSRQRISKK